MKTSDLKAEIKEYIIEILSEDKDKDKVVAKGEGIELTQAQMDKLHAGKIIKLPNGSTLAFIKEEVNEALLGAEEAIEQFYGDKIEPGTLKLDWSLPGGQYTAKSLEGEDIYFDMGRHHFRVFRIEDWHDYVNKAKGIPVASSEHRQLEDEFNKKMIDYVLFGLPGKQPEMEETLTEGEEDEDREPTKAELEKEKVKGAPSKFKVTNSEFEDFKDKLKTLVKKIKDMEKGEAKDKKMAALKQFIKKPELVKAFKERDVKIDTGGLVG